MDYEKKYKEALERAKQVYKTPYTAHWGVMKELIEHLFPELKESEDEGIRTALLNHLKKMWGNANDDVCGVHVEDVIAWLEKQGEKEKFIEKELGYIRGYREEALSRLQELEKQGKQNPITDFSNLRTWKYIVDAVLTEKEGIGQYLDSPFTEEVAKKLQKRFGNIEQIPTEWSEEDEQLIDEVAVCLRKYEEKVQGGYSKFYVQSLADRIESLRPGNTCKATGWSEKDEKLLKLSLENLTELKNRFDEGYGKVGDCIAWLKSLKDRIK